MSTGRTTVTLGEERMRRLSDADNTSEVIRKALDRYWGETPDYGLPDLLAKVYDALLDHVGQDGGRALLDVLKKSIPQHVNQVSKETVVDAAFRPLEARGFINPIQGIDTVWIQVHPPDEVDAVEQPDVTRADEHADAILNGDYQIGEEVGSA